MGEEFLHHNTFLEVLQVLHFQLCLFYSSIFITRSSGMSYGFFNSPLKGETHIFQKAGRPGLLCFCCLPFHIIKSLSLNFVLIVCQNNFFINSNGNVVVEDTPVLPHIFLSSAELYHLTWLEEGFLHHDTSLEVPLVLHFQLWLLYSSW